MQIDLASHIEKLIFLNDTVVVPNLGAFVATRISSTTTEDGGATNVINPPTRALAFNETLVYDDGLLTGEIAQAHGISTDEARNLVQTEVEALQQRLNQREIVSLNGIGRLYKNYVQKIQFLPDAANFSTESYGLPPLQFSTIARSREVTETQSPEPAATPYTPPQATPAPAVGEETPTSETPVRSTRWVTPLLISILVLLIAAVAVWQWQSAKNGQSILDRLRGTETPAIDSTEQAATAPETGSTTDVQTPTEATTESTDDGGVEIEMLTPEEPKPEEATLVLTPESQEAVLDSPEKTKTTGKECILIVATLSDPGNIQKLKTKLKDNNFTVYDAPKGKGRQIGIRFNYDDVVDIQNNIIALQQLTGQTEIWIKKK